MAGFGILGLIAWIWHLFVTKVAKPIKTLAGVFCARAHADATGEMDSEIARYLGDLAPAARAATASLEETRNALAESVARETARLAEEKARLETLLSDAPVGGLLCSGDHALVFYNGQAVDLMAAGATPGLDRKFADLLRMGPVNLARARLVGTGDPDAATGLLCSTVSGARILAARMRLLPAGNGPPPGYVVTLCDVTVDLATHARREALLAELMNCARRPTANLSTLLEVIPEGQAGPGKLDAAIRQEVSALATAITDLSRRQDDVRQESWPLAQTRASDLADGLKARLEVHGLPLETNTANLLLRCNGFEIISLLDDLALHLRDKAGATGLHLSVEEEATGATIRLLWSGKALPIGQLDHRQEEPPDRAVPDIPCASVLATHATEIRPESAGDRQSLCLPIRQARRAVQRPKATARNVVYDFDLLARACTDKVADTPLSALNFVDFDAETIGLLPEQGDEIVQVAAVRIVNGCKVDGEVFDTLVNPRRSIPRSSTDVHGITDAMVAEARSSRKSPGVSTNSPKALC